MKLGHLLLLTLALGLELMIVGYILEVYKYYKEKLFNKATAITKITSAIVLFIIIVVLVYLAESNASLYTQIRYKGFLK